MMITPRKVSELKKAGFDPTAGEGDALISIANEIQERIRNLGREWKRANQKKLDQYDKKFEEARETGNPADVAANTLLFLLRQEAR
jgi:hypothetical protein